MKTEIRAKVRKALLFAMVLDIAIAAAVVLKNLNSSSRTFEAKIFQSIADRAQVNLFEDFRGGLDAWESNQPLTRTWSYDPSGLVSPGQLALFKPSKHLENYEVETGAEVIKGFGLIFRAATPQSYHAVRFMNRGSGAEAASLAAERYTVMNGAISTRRNIFIPIGVQRDAICRLRLLVQGDTFTLYVRGQLVDSWSDGRLHSGGIGMFCGKDDGARIAWVRVSHHADVTGKLCAVASSLSRIGL